MTDVTTSPAPAPDESTTATAAVTDLQAYRQMAQQLIAMHFQSAHDGWSLSAFHPFAASVRTNLR